MEQSRETTVANVAVVTDSTADIPQDMAEERELRVVPMTVTFGDESYISGVTMLTDDFYDRMARHDALPRTSQPIPAWFEEAYQDAADHGADAIVSVHLSSKLSGTCELARLVAKHAELPVTVVDSGQAGGGLALAVFAALRAAQRGADADEIAATAESVAEEARLYFVVDDLDHLRRGGRLSTPQAVIGSFLRVKPVLTVANGGVEPLEKVRTWQRAIDRLGELAGEHAAGRPADVIVTHALAADRAAAVWRAVDGRVDVRNRLETILGPVLATHAGPGTVGVALAPRHDGPDR